jgi:hypothetical protein
MKDTRCNVRVSKLPPIVQDWNNAFQRMATVANFFAVCLCTLEAEEKQ